MTEGAPRRSTWWLATAVAFSTATLLRVPGLPLGPSEVLLLGWIAFEAGTAVARDRLSLTEPARAFVGFWTCGFLLMSAGWMWAGAHQVQAAAAFRDFIAYSLAALFTVTLTIRPGAMEQLRRAGPLVVLLSTLPLFALSLTTLVGITPWGWAGRFVGWSMNPNQVALAMTPVPFAALYAWRTAQRRRDRALFALALVGSVVVGIASLSEGLFLAWIAAGGAAMGLAWLEVVRRGRAPFRTAAVAYVLVPVCLVLGAVIAGPVVYVGVVETVDTLYNAQGGQGSLRVRLWTSGMRNVVASPLFGWGPGAHTTAFAAPVHESEAHNGLVDWTTVTGVPGMLLFLALHGWILWRTSRRPLLFAVATSLLVLGVTHHDLRHPTYWFYLLFAVAAAAAGGGRGGAATLPATGGAAPSSPAGRP